MMKFKMYNRTWTVVHPRKWLVASKTIRDAIDRGSVLAVADDNQELTIFARSALDARALSYVQNKGYAQPPEYEFYLKASREATPFLFKIASKEDAIWRAKSIAWNPDITPNSGMLVYHGWPHPTGKQPSIPAVGFGEVSRDVLEAKLMRLFGY